MYKTLSHSKILCQSGSSKFIAAKVHERCGLTYKVQEKIIELSNSVTKCVLKLRGE